MRYRSFVIYAETEEEFKSELNEIEQKPNTSRLRNKISNIIFDE